MLSFIISSLKQQEENSEGICLELSFILLPEESKDTFRGFSLSI